MEQEDRIKLFTMMPFPEGTPSEIVAAVWEMTQMPEDKLKESLDQMEQLVKKQPKEKDSDEKNDFQTTEGVESLDTEPNRKIRDLMIKMYRDLMHEMVQLTMIIFVQYILDDMPIEKVKEGFPDNAKDQVETVCKLFDFYCDEWTKDEIRKREKLGEELLAAEEDTE